MFTFGTYQSLLYREKCSHEVHIFSVLHILTWLLDIVVTSGGSVLLTGA